MPSITTPTSVKLEDFVEDFSGLSDMDFIDLTMDDIQYVKLEPDTGSDTGSDIVNNNIIDLTGDFPVYIKQEPAVNSIVKQEPIVNSIVKQEPTVNPIVNFIKQEPTVNSIVKQEEPQTQPQPQPQPIIPLLLQQSQPVFPAFIPPVLPPSPSSSSSDSDKDDDNDDDDNTAQITANVLESMFSGLQGEITPPHRRLPTPVLLVTPLLEYQKLGLEWMINREKKDCRGGLLADQMGLGKTIQSIALIFQDGYVNRRTTLVVCPASLTRQWKEEIVNKVPTAKVLNYHEKRKSGDKLLKYDVVITTYQRIVTEYKQSKKLNKVEKLLKRHAPLLSFEWTRVILDEAHQIRNRRTQACKAVEKIPAKHRWCLTGTPIQNRISDAFAYLQFLRIPPYSKWSNFRRSIERPFSIPARRQLALERLQAIFKIFCLRREKSYVLDGEVIFKAAAKTEVLHKCKFSEEERDFYGHVEKETQLKFQRYLRQGRAIKRQMFILALLTQLRQAACHPSLIKLADEEDGKNGENVKGNKRSYSEDESDEDNVVRKRRRMNVIADDESDTDDIPVSPVAHVVIPPVDYKLSTKVQKALEIVRQLPANEKIIIFSSFTRFLDILDNFLGKENLQTHYYTGTVSVAERHEILKKFATDNTRILLMSLKCGSLGLNLTCATQVILLDPWWNPAIEDQAGDRIHRIGQDRPITVHRLYVDESVEQRVLQLQDAKRQLINSILGADSLQALESRLTMKDFKLLFGLQPAKPSLSGSGGRFSHN